LHTIAKWKFQAVAVVQNVLNVVDMMQNANITNVNVVSHSALFVLIQKQTANVLTSHHIVDLVAISFSKHLLCFHASVMENNHRFSWHFNKKKTLLFFSCTLLFPKHDFVFIILQICHMMWSCFRWKSVSELNQKDNSMNKLTLKQLQNLYIDFSKEVHHRKRMHLSEEKLSVI